VLRKLFFHFNTSIRQYFNTILITKIQNKKNADAQLCICICRIDLLQKMKTLKNIEKNIPIKQIVVNGNLVL